MIVESPHRRGTMVFRWRLTLTVLLASAVLSSCASREFERLMQTWGGRRMSELLATWGPPRYAYSNGSGGYVFVYVPASGVSGGTQPILASGAQLADRLVHGSVPDTQPVFRPDITATWPVFRLFFISEDGKIYRSQWKGNWVCCGT